MVPLYPPATRIGGRARAITSYYLLSTLGPHSHPFAQFSCLYISSMVITYRAAALEISRLQISGLGTYQLSESDIRLWQHVLVRPGTYAPARTPPGNLPNG